MITLQFCSFGSLMGYLIDWFSHGAVGHVDAVDDAGNLWGAQEQSGLGGAPSGVQIRAPDYGDMTDKIRVTLPSTPAQDLLFWDFLRDQLGKPYDVTAILAFVAGRNWQEPDAWFCSELQGAALIRAGILPNHLAAPANKITPADLLLLCSGFAPAEPV